MNKIQVAVVGAGLIGPVHIEALRRLGITVAGVLGVNEAESIETKEALNIDRAYKDYDELLNDSSIQSVHLAIPNILHYEYAKKAILAGKHVLCEKPLAMNSKQSAELVELAKNHNIAAGVCYNVRFYPVNLESRQKMLRNELGDIFHINGSYVQDWLLYNTDYNWRVLADQGGELRAVADIGTHWMDLLQTITGKKITDVFADLHTIHPVRNRPKGEVKTFSGKMESQTETEPIDITTEDYGCILFRLDKTIRGQLYVSQVVAGRKNCIRYEIAGSQQTLAWNSESPNDLWIGYRDKPNQTLMRDPALMSEDTRPYINYPGGHNEGFPDTFKQLFRAFYGDIESGQFKTNPSFPTFGEGHHEVQLCEAILKSHREQTWVSV